MVRRTKTSLFYSQTGIFQSTDKLVLQHVYALLSRGAFRMTLATISLVTNDANKHTFSQSLGGLTQRSHAITRTLTKAPLDSIHRIMPSGLFPVTRAPAPVLLCKSRATNLHRGSSDSITGSRVEEEKTQVATSTSVASMARSRHLLIE